MVIHLSLEEAANLIEDDIMLALGGMTIYRRPMAFALSLLKRTIRPKNLTLMNFTAGIESDLLIGAGCVKSIRSVYCGLEAFGLAPMFTTTAQQGKLHIIEETEASIVMGLRAHMAGIGFMPSRAWQRTDLPKLRDDVVDVIDPYSGETLTAFPAIDVDVCVLHGLASDSQGNVLLNNNLGIDLELVYASSLVIVTVEQYVDSIERTPQTTILPAPGADYIALAPGGAKPTSCYPLYPLDGLEIMRYVEMCNAGEFEVYLEDLLMRL